jgi:hypothetical protein
MSGAEGVSDSGWDSGGREFSSTLRMRAHCECVHAYEEEDTCI